MRGKDETRILLKGDDDEYQNLFGLVTIAVATSTCNFYVEVTLFTFVPSAQVPRFAERRSWVEQNLDVSILVFTRSG